MGNSEIKFVTDVKIYNSSHMHKPLIGVISGMFVPFI